MKFLRKHPILGVLIIVFLIIFLWSLLCNKALTVTEYSIHDAQIPTDFDGFRIAQVSDLHCAEFGPQNEKLLTLLRETQPDMIAITGDLVDTYHDDFTVSIAFIQEVVKIAPVYYVTGNHEAIPEYAALKAELVAAGITVLENESLLLENERASITVTGLLDPAFGVPIPDLSADGYQVVLSHRPELIDLYAQQGFDLVFSGHAHGGQFRLPFIGGIWAPHQGFFPKYDGGMYARSDTTLIVSRGLGNSLFPLRVNNRPELILVTLESD